MWKKLLDELFEDLIRRRCEEMTERRRRAHSLRFQMLTDEFSVTGDNMSFSMQVGFMVSGTVSPMTGETPPKPSSAKLSNQVYTSSDPTIFTVAADATNPNGFTVSGIGTIPAGSTQISATLTAKATATEPDGTTTEVIQGVETIILTAAPPPPPAPAASLAFTFGTPVPIPPPVPPAPAHPIA